MRRYERASRLLTSNRPVEDWGKLLADAAAVGAMLDRLLHHGHVLKCGPKSWRAKTAVADERRKGKGALIDARALPVALPGFIALSPEWRRAALWSHPCGAISPPGFRQYSTVFDSIPEAVENWRSFSLPPGAVVGYNNLVWLDFYWPVLRCPSLAGFQVSPEAVGPFTIFSPGY